MTLNELPKETLRAELEFVRPLLEVGRKTAAKLWAEIDSPICTERYCTKCPNVDRIRGGSGVCNLLGKSATVHAAAREYLAALEAALREGGAE